MAWTLFPISGLKIGTDSIVSAFSSNGYSTVAIGSSPVSKSDLSGAMTANTLKTYLSETGNAGEISALAYSVNDTTSRTVRFVVTVDGNTPVAYDAVSAAITVSGRGAVICGSVASSAGNAIINIPPIYYKNSILIEYASSITETDKLTILCTRAKYR